RINDTIYFNPADIEYPIAFNVVEQVAPHLRHLVASGLIGVFQKLWADSWGPRLEYILRNSILAILDYPGSTLLGVTRMLSDKVFRRKVIAKIQDPVVKAFWVNEFAGYADKFAAEAVSPIQNKVGQFLSSSLIRNIVGQVKSSIDMREIMDEGKILIMNLSKGRIGEDNSSLLGSMMITKIQLAAMSRVNIPENQRRDCYLYIDEFQNFTTDSFANILSEARKYRLDLIMANQYIEQLGDVVKAAVFGNIGTLIVFRVGATDAEELVKEFTPTFTEEDLVSLPKYEMYLKLMIDGIASDPFSARGLTPLPEGEKTNNVEKVIRVTRERYAKERKIVEDKIMRWHENDGGEDEKEKSAPGRIDRPAPAKRPVERLAADTRANPVRNSGGAKREENYRLGGAGKKEDNRDNEFDVICSRCGKKTTISFKPDGIRPVYCKECLSALREEKRQEVELRKKSKQEELKRIEEEDLRGESGPELTLEEIKKIQPVDFKDRKKNEFKNNFSGGNNERNIKEGEEIEIG
ncbi:MAG: TraM recognition domain-containing protein, partial [Patescibacteria group bacterium]|nr:TraM recognition domain-containing protein [Patescibacteria group bacterium]